MLKKSLVCALVGIILSLCCTMCFAEENGNKINLGNEIMRSIDKTGNSMENVISGNVVNDAGNMMENGINMVGDGVRDIGNTMSGAINDMDDTSDNMNNDMENREGNRNTVAGGVNDGNYNTTRTTADQTLNAGINTMTATTWMWIILIVAAVTIMAAIWYYATQSNK